MSQLTSQASFDGFAVPVATDRLFFAVIPDVTAVQGITHLTQLLRSEHALRGKPIRPDRLHATLHHVGDFVGLPPGVIANAAAAAAKVSMPAIQVVFDSVSSFANRSRQRPLVLRGDAGVADLMRLQRRLCEQLKMTGLQGTLDRTFTPHVTLLYDERILLPQPVEPVAWTAHEFVLVHSLLRKSEYRIVGRWVLPV